MREIKLINLKVTTICKRHPLLAIIFLAFIVRLFAVFFSQGYLMHDDHFLVIEAAQSWVDGYDYNNWLPKNRNEAVYIYKILTSK